MKEFRPYQQSLIDKTIASEKDDIICLPTGGGKTVIASGIINRLDRKVIFVVPRLELIRQAKDEFGDVDIIWSDKTSLEGRHCILASKDSLRTQYSNLPEQLKEDIHNGIMIIDEAHVSIEQTCKLVKMMKPRRVIGLTATPERMDGLALLKGDDSIHKYGVFDDVIQEETVASLIKKGFLTKLKYYTKPIDGITDVKPENAMSEELSGKQMMRIFDDNQIWGDLVKSYEEYGKGRPALGFTNTIAMAETVVDVFTKAGYNFKVIHGEMGVKERQELIDALREHTIDGLVNASLLTYGFDCPPVSYAFNCRHIKSRPLWFQIVGRILRPFEGKENAIFVDHADAISEFSDPDCSLPILDETIKWRADGESKEQKRIRKNAMRKVRDTMKQIQEWDPLPAELVEVTMENTWERLLRIIKRLKKENADLLSVNRKLQQEIGDSQIIIQAEKDRANEIACQNIQIQAEKKRLEYAQQMQQRRVKQLEEENRTMKESGDIVRYADPDRTFEFIKKRYIFYRKRIVTDNPGITREDAHKMVGEKFREEEQNQPFLFDRSTYARSMQYWFDNYEKRVVD